MIVGETFTIEIEKIHKIEEGKRVVFVTMDTRCYSRETNKTYAFWKKHWDKIHSEMKFTDNMPLMFSYARKIEEMSDCEFCQRYSLDLSQIPAHRLVDEINRRISANELSFEYALEYRVQDIRIVDQDFDHTLNPTSTAKQIL